MPKVPILNIAISCLLVIMFMLSAMGVTERFAYWQLCFGSFRLESGWVANHMLFSFFHANIFHLLGNLLCLVMLKGRMHVAADFVSAVVASFMPVIFIPALSPSLPVCGFSAVLFAEVGIRFGRSEQFMRMIKASWLFFTIIFFVPKIVMGIHLYAMIIGYLIGLWVYRKK